MPIYTPNGLKIRLDSEAVEEIIQPLAEHHDMNDVLLDVELWEDLPEEFTAISVSIAALFFASSVGPLLITGLLAYIVGSFVRSLMYSDLLRVFVNSLGAWLGDVPAAVEFGRVAAAPVNTLRQQTHRCQEISVCF